MPSNSPEYAKQHRLTHKEQHKKSCKKWIEKNKEHLKKYREKWSEQNPNYFYDYAKNNREKINAICRKSRSKNGKYRYYQKIYASHRYATDPEFKARHKEAVKRYKDKLKAKKIEGLLNAA